MENKNDFDFKEFITSSRDVLLNPKEFFPRIELTGGIVQPLIKALIYGAVAGLFSMIWSFAHLGGALGGMFGGAAGIGVFFLTIVSALIVAFIMGVIFLVLSSICGGNTDYEANFRVAVAIMVVYPISIFLNFLGGINFWLDTLVELAINLYALYLLYFGLTLALKGKEQSAKVTSYVLGGILLLFVIIGATTHKAARSFSKYGAKRFEKELSDIQRVAREIEKEATANYKDMLNELEDVQEEITETLDDAIHSEQNNKQGFAKPATYPTEAVEYANDWFSQSESTLTKKKINQVVEITKELKLLEEGQVAEIMDIIEENGYDGIAEYQQDMVKSIVALEGLKGIITLQELIDATPDEQRAAEIFTVDTGIESIVKQTINAGKLTEDDIRLAYDNWDKIAELTALNKKK